MKTLTKSLHTVTAVTRVAAHLKEMHPVNLDAKRLTDRALTVLGYSVKDISPNDDTYLRCINGVKGLKL